MNAQLRDSFIALVGAKNALVAETEVAPHLREWRGRWTGRTAAVLKPANTAEVSAILQLATRTRTPIVPQGGNTGLVGGQIPDDVGNAIIVSTQRLDRIREIDLEADTMTVEAGVILETIQQTASRHDRLFPLSLGAKGSCQIGGNLSTNAGGTGALAYGVARDLCLGLEVVLPDGAILDGLSKLKKDNTGYDLRDLFIGAEGTLGIITAAVIRLHPRPRGMAAAIVGTRSPENALSLLRSARTAAHAGLSAFELMDRTAVAFTVRHLDDVREPLAATHPYYVLIEVSSHLSHHDARARLEAILEAGLAAGDIDDGVIAQNEAQRLAFWRMREGIAESQRHEGVSIKHDISVPVGAIPAFMAQARAAVGAIAPEARICALGHMGDGNLHYNISQPAGWDGEVFARLKDQITPAVHEIVRAHGGSFSAEHGIGQMKRDELAATKSAVALDLMRRIKTAFDPAGIMNPGKML